jgi:DNA-binding GntR family transcriptional regulator
MPDDAPPARGTPLQIDLARKIARLIADGVLAGGAHLTEQMLCERFEVSRTPVRGALALLARRGWIDYRANSGYFVGMGGAPQADPALDGAGADDLYRDLIAARATGRLPDTVTEKELLRQHAAPKSLLDKVLRRMLAEGLIEKRPGRGWRFPPALETPEALAESYRFRLLVECGGLLEPSFAADAAELAACRLSYEQLLQRDATALAPADFFAMNAAFHEMLARFSGNRFVLAAVQQQTQLRRFEEHAAFYRQIDVRRACEEHLHILAALQSGDTRLAAALMRSHLLTAQESSLRGTLAPLRVSAILYLFFI